MHVSYLFKPFGWGLGVLGVIVTIASLISEIFVNGGMGSGGSDSGGFEL
jgi:hypothetical protein